MSRDVVIAHFPCGETTSGPVVLQTPEFERSSGRLSTVEGVNVIDFGDGG
jgi:hypothetical protein